MLWACAWAAHAEPQVHHDLAVTLDPSAGSLSVHDRITLPAGGTPERPSHWTFLLHADLQPRLLQPDGAELHELERAEEGGVAVHRYRLILPAGQHQLELAYGGVINQRVSDADAAAGVRPDTSGYIGSDGIYLDGDSYWYPWFGGELRNFTLTVRLPQGWSAVSQGAETPLPDADGEHQAQWSEPQPQEDIYLVAARFQRYTRPGTWAEAMVYLRRPDQQLAARYLDATGHYLDLYSRLLGPYPYPKFALVENFWESGFGMPSFTLLGPQVIRLPFIIDTSYPHEILHNWWGNSVYVDYRTGNWSEGLTTYLADYLLAEQRGQGADYRRNALQQYADYVATARDFPLARFRGRHGKVSQAVGYSKGLMLFHMLRRRLGDDVFVQGLRKFYRDNRFRRAGFADLRAAFEAVSGQPLQTLFTQWVQRTGAPQLRISGVRVEPRGDGYRVRGLLEQTQDGPAYDLRVPVAVQGQGDAEAQVFQLPMHGKRLQLDLAVRSRPLRLAVDPAFDLFRRLQRGEIPPAVSQLFGADNPLFVLPSAAPAALRGGYRALAEHWADRADQIVWDDDLQALPTDRAVWVLGWNNRFRQQVEQMLGGQAPAFTDSAVTIDGATVQRSDTSVVLVARQPGNPDKAVGWIGCADPIALPGLARKVPHYGKYSYLTFQGPSPSNVLKGQWPVRNSPLQVTLVAGTEAPLRLPPRPPLTAVLKTTDKSD